MYRIVDSFGWAGILALSQPVRRRTATSISALICSSYYYACFFRFFRACDRFHLASRFTSSSFETLNILLTALLNRSASVSPGTFGAGAGFILPSILNFFRS
jgi:hypothetical protein